MNHLQIRSCYSLLKSPFQIEEIVDTAIENGFQHVCLTDINYLFGVMPFYQYCLKKGIHPILGMEVKALYQDEFMNFVLLAKNDDGLQGLYKLSTYISCVSEIIDIEQLSSYTQNCFVLTSGDSDQLEQWMEREDKESVQNYFKQCQELWHDFYVSIAMNDSKYRREKNKILKEYAKELEIPTVALSRIYYKKQDDVETLRLQRAIDRQTNLQDQTLDVTYGRYFRTQKEMEELYDQEDLEMTDVIAKQCNVQMALPKSHLPVFKNKLDIDNETYLIKLCKKGLQKRLNNKVPDEYVKRLEYELSVITKMGFTDYFLIVWDFIRESRQRDVYVGPGRGSAAGSLAAYCLGITHVDPIENHLFFERFLNPERISMPDIDTDFPDDRRDEIIDYVREKYGNEHVAHIVTFNRLKAKQALRDVARVMNYSPRKVDELTKIIPSNSKLSLMEIYQSQPSFQKLVNQDDKGQTKLLFSRALKIEGMPRHLSLHAAGIVLSDQEIENVCPLVNVDGQTLATQYTMEYLENLGLIKFDFLAIRNLTTIYSIVDSLRKHENIDLDLLKLPLNDSKTFDVLSRGDTLGIFQLESQGIKQLLMKIKPNHYEDICAVLALYRPGPMQNIDTYIENRKHPENIKYVDERLRPILQETYGIIVYQEQIMQIAQVISGFTLAQADQLRKAMSKKNMDLMNSYKEQFISGAIRNRCTKKTAEEIFDWIQRFAEYGFNKSHSYAYSLTSYQMAYLKANYPTYFYQHLLDSVLGSSIKTSQYIYECNKRNIQVLQPSVCFSKKDYSIEKNQIRMPLSSLKGIGKTVYEPILKEREKGEFLDFIDFIVRATANKIGEASLHTLINGGALDDFEYNRATMNENLNRVIVYSDLIRTETDEGTLFNYDIVAKPKLMMMKENPSLKSKKEHELLGFYISEHPIHRIRKQYPKSTPIAQCETKDGYYDILGQIIGYRIHKTKNQQNMAFVSIEDETGKIDVVVMPRLFEKNRQRIQKDAIIYVRGKKDRPQSILANQIYFYEAESN